MYGPIPNYDQSDPTKSRSKPLPKWLFLFDRIIGYKKQLKKEKRSIGVRVPIDEPLDYGKFPTSTIPKAKEFLSDADYIVGRR